MLLCRRDHQIKSNPASFFFFFLLYFSIDLKAFNILFTFIQGGITCGAIDEPRKSSKAIDERIIINLCDKNVAIALFRDKKWGSY